MDYEHSLNKAVRKLREVLDDDADQPHYIETLSKRGYRFVHALDNSSEEVAPEAASAEAPPARTRFRARLGSGIAIAAAAVVVAAFYLRTSHSTRQQPTLEKLVVLPFLNLSEDPRQEFLCQGKIGR